MSIQLRRRWLFLLLYSFGQLREYLGLLIDLFFEQEKMLCVFELIFDELLVLIFELLVEVREEIACFFLLLAERHVAFVSFTVFILFSEIGGLFCNAFRTLFFQLSDLPLNILDLLKDHLNIYLVILHLIHHLL